MFPGEIRGVAGNAEKDENLLGEALGKQANFSRALWIFNPRARSFGTMSFFFFSKLSHRRRISSGRWEKSREQSGKEMGF